MATLIERTRGGSLMFEIRYYADGKRKTIPLSGKYKRIVNELMRIVEDLQNCLANGVEHPGKRLVSRIESLPPELQDKLAKAGLIDKPQRRTVKELWEAHRNGLTVKEATQNGYGHAERRFFYFFDPDEELSELTKERMRQWKQYLLKEAPNERTGKPGLAVSTTAGTISKAKAVFNHAVDILGWLEKSPLDGVGRGSFVNEEYDRHVTMDEYYRLLDVCPCQEWRVIVALVRIGGLRAPSEVLRLKWTDINWQHPARFYVAPYKTKARVVPLFPVLHTELRRLFEGESSVGTEFVINRYRDPERTNLGTQFGRIVKMAGVQPIPRPFDNMRASRSTEIYAEFNPFLESKWIGHSQKVARKHYLQVREEDLAWGVGGPSPKDRAGNSNGTTAAQVQEEDFERAVGSESPGQEVFHPPKKIIPPVNNVSSTHFSTCTPLHPLAGR